MKKLVRILISEFVYGGHLLSLGAASIVWSVTILLDVEWEWQIFIIAYLVSQIVYNHDHLLETIEENKDNLERSIYLSETRNIQIFTMIIYITLFISLLFTTTYFAALLAVIIVAGGIIYSLKVKYLMKKVVALKNLYVAFFWTMLGFIVPLHYSIFPLRWLVLTFLFFVFLRWIINSAFFDIKDVSGDKKDGLKTLPVVFGLHKTVYYLHIVNIASGTIVALAIWLRILPFYSIVLLFFPIYSLIYLIKVNNLTSVQLRKISYIMVDGEYILWPLALLLGKVIME